MVDELSWGTQSNLNSEPLNFKADEIAVNYEFSIVIRRWFATVVDLIILAGIVFSYFLLMGKYSVNIYSGNIINKNSNFIILSVIWYAMMLILLLYYPILEGFVGYTIGKYMAKIRVVNEDCNPPGIGKAIIRTLFRLIEVNPFLLGGIPAGIIVSASKNKQRLGDMVAKTFVVKTINIEILDIKIAPIKKIVSNILISFTVMLLVIEIVLLCLN